MQVRVTPLYTENVKFIVPEVLSQVYDDLIIHDFKDVDMFELKEKLGVLLQTLVVNPAQFFSF